MPKFSTPEAEEQYRAAVKQRRIYAAEHVASVLPGPTEKPISKAKLFERATAAAVKNGLNDEPFFSTAANPAERFHTFLVREWRGEEGIRSILQADVGISTDFGHGMRGIRRAGKRGAELTAGWLGHVVEQEKVVTNNYIDGAKKLLGARLKLIP